jgi:hypothetical protein
VQDDKAEHTAETRAVCQLPETTGQIITAADSSPTLRGVGGRLGRCQGSHSRSVAAQAPDGAGHEDREPQGQVQDPAPLKGAAGQRVVDKLAQPAQRRELGKVCKSGENWLSGMNRPPAKLHSVSASAMTCVTFSDGSPPDMAQRVAHRPMISCGSRSFHVTRVASRGVARARTSVARAPNYPSPSARSAVPAAAAGPAPRAAARTAAAPPPSRCGPAAGGPC